MLDDLTLSKVLSHEKVKGQDYLKRGNFRHRYQTFVPFAKIDIKASKENPARLTTAVDDMRVTKYGIQMIDDMPSPAIVLLNLPGGVIG